MSVNNRNKEYLLHALRKKPRRHTTLPPPKMSDDSHDPYAWFQHFDIDRSGTLSQREAIHGLYVTLNALTSKQRADIRKYILSWDAWEAHDETRLETRVLQARVPNVRQAKETRPSPLDPRFARGQ